MTLWRDTRPEAEAVMIEGLRRMPVARRLELVCAMWRTGRELARLGLRLRHPGASEEQLDALYARLTLGDELAERVLATRRARDLAGRDCDDRDGRRAG